MPRLCPSRPRNFAQQRDDSRTATMVMLRRRRRRRRSDRRCSWWRRGEKRMKDEYGVRSREFGEPDARVCSWERWRLVGGDALLLGNVTTPWRLGSLLTTGYSPVYPYLLSCYLRYREFSIHNTKILLLLLYGFSFQACRDAKPNWPVLAGRGQGPRASLAYPLSLPHQLCNNNNNNNNNRWTCIYAVGRMGGHGKWFSTRLSAYLPSAGPCQANRTGPLVLVGMPDNYMGRLVALARFHFAFLRIPAQPAMTKHTSLDEEWDEGQRGERQHSRIQPYMIKRITRS